MSILQLTLCKLRQFPLSKVTVALAVLMGVQLLMGASTVPIVGLCAGVMPLFCQAGAMPKAPEGTPAIIDALTTYLQGLVIAGIYLLGACALTFAGLALNPAFAVGDVPVGEMYLLGAGCSVVFVSATMPAAVALKPMQRVGLGIVLVNAELVVLMAAPEVLRAVPVPSLAALTGGFSLLIMALTCASLFLGGRTEVHGRAGQAIDR